MTKTFSFNQVDVFTDQALKGNPLAVVHRADELSQREMQDIANWTNLSETTFLLNPINQEADYRVKIFTPKTELPFAGHPTLGSCFAWIKRGGLPKSKDFIIQECEIGLVKIRNANNRLSFSAPNLIKTGPIDVATLQTISKGIGVSMDEIVHHQWVDNGPGWCAVMLKTADQVLNLKLDPQLLKHFKLGVIGPHPDGNSFDFEVRAFVFPYGIAEDPVTGSLNAGIASWLFRDNLIQKNYCVSQGTALGRAGKIYIERQGDFIWVGGEVVNCISGELQI
jgi:PhzF family phenazine biosynthesis protein